jgi:hypothetical protein
MYWVLATPKAFASRELPIKVRRREDATTHTRDAYVPQSSARAAANALHSFDIPSSLSRHSTFGFRLPRLPAREDFRSSLAQAAHLIHPCDPFDPWWNQRVRRPKLGELETAAPWLTPYNIRVYSCSPRKRMNSKVFSAWVYTRFIRLPRRSLARRRVVNSYFRKRFMPSRSMMARQM